MCSDIGLMQQMHRSLDHVLMHLLGEAFVLSGLISGEVIRLDLNE